MCRVKAVTEPLVVRSFAPLKLNSEMPDWPSSEAWFPVTAGRWPGSGLQPSTVSPTLRKVNEGGI